MAIRKRLTSMQIIKMLDLIDQDEEFQKRYKEIYDECNRKVDNLYKEFKQKYLPQVIEKDRPV